jgi:hypothetical protein
VGKMGRGEWVGGGKREEAYLGKGRGVTTYVSKSSDQIAG